MALQKQAIKGGGTWQLLPPCSVLGQFFHYRKAGVPGDLAAAEDQTVG